jgi:predicted dehydrogenase
MPQTADRIMKSAQCEISAVYDVDGDAAREEAAKINAPVASSLWALLENPEVDIIYAAVPHALHAPIGVEAARADKHVIVEKPVASTYEDALFLAGECEKHDVKLTAHMPFCFSASSAISKELIAKGAIGKIASTRIHSIGYKGDEYWERGVGGKGRRSYWRAFNSMSGGGILIMNAVHNIDQMLYITGLQPVTVASRGGVYTAAAAVEDSIALLIGYDKNNAFGVVEAMSSAYGASHSDNATAIFGDKGVIRFGFGDVELFTSVEGLGYETGKWITIPSSAVKHRNFFDDFAAAVRGEKEQEVSVPQILSVIDTITTAYRAMRSGATERVQGRHLQNNKGGYLQ